jgi:hypothetical protein
MYKLSVLNFTCFIHTLMQYAKSKRKKIDLFLVSIHNLSHVLHDARKCVPEKFVF